MEEEVAPPKRKRRAAGKRKASEETGENPEGKTKNRATRKRRKRTKKDVPVVKIESANASRMGHVVWVGKVPPSLCASEDIVRELFSTYGELLSIKIHHNYVDMSVDGFVYLEYSAQDEAEAAVAAVKNKLVGIGESEPDTEGSVDPRTLTGMEAELAKARGEPQVEVDEEIRDLLLGKRQMNRFSQQTQNEELDEDELMLQSLSQHSFSSSQPRKKRKKSSKKSKRS